MEPIVGIGTVIESGKEVYTVKSIQGHYVFNSIGDLIIKPVLVVSTPGLPDQLMDGVEVEKALGL